MVFDGVMEDSYIQEPDSISQKSIPDSLSDSSGTLSVCLLDSDNKYQGSDNSTI